MAGANPSAYGGEGSFPGIFKFQHLNRENEQVNPKTLGTEFHRRLVFPITQANPYIGYQGSVGTALTMFQAGNIGLDWLLDNTTPTPITGPSAVNVFFFNNGGGYDRFNPITTIDLNSIASSQALFVPPTDPESFQDWTVNFDNRDVVAKTINFGAGITPASLIIPAGTTIRATFEIVTREPPTIRIIPYADVGIGGLIGPAGGENLGPPIQGHDTLVWDGVSGTYVPSGLTTSTRNGRFPGLEIGAAGTTYAAGDNFALVVRGGPPQGMTYNVLTNDPAGAQQFDIYRGDTSGNVATTFGTRGFQDSVYSARIFNPGTNPVDANRQGPGAYQYLGGRQVGVVLTTNFRITADGEISDFTPLATAALAALSVSAAGGITQGVSRAEAKENVVALTDLESDHYFDSLHPVSFNYIGLPDLPRMGFVVQQSEADLTANDNKLFSFLPGDPINLAYRADFDNRAVIALLVKQVKALQARVTALENP
jgi:hypothetical protein